MATVSNQDIQAFVAGPPMQLQQAAACMQDATAEPAAPPTPQSFTPPPAQTPARESKGDILIELRNVHKSFGGKAVLRGTNITIRRGEAVGIIGSSGSGKSTTLRLMAGLMAPDWVRCTAPPKR